MPAASGCSVWAVGRGSGICMAIEGRMAGAECGRCGVPEARIPQVQRPAMAAPVNRMEAAALLEDPRGIRQRMIHRLLQTGFDALRDVMILAFHEAAHIPVARRVDAPDEFGRNGPCPVCRR